MAPGMSFRGVNGFLVTRYIVLALFIICNAIVCSIAVWNFSLVQSFPQPARVDVYLIALGAFALLSVFSLIFVELLCTNPLTTRVWFECMWVTLFWVMELAGGAALVAIKSDIPCWIRGYTYLDVLCTSERLLLAFTWMDIIILLVYLLVLVFFASSQHQENPHVWRSDVRTLRPTVTKQHSSNASTSPLTTSQLKKSVSVETYTPHPESLQTIQVLRAHTGLGNDYQIEPFPPAFVIPEPMDDSRSPSLREAIPIPSPAAAPAVSLLLRPPSTEASGKVRSPVPFELPRLASSITYVSSSLPSRVPNQNKTLPSSSPLGDWPRPDIMQLPVKRPLPPPGAFEFPRMYAGTIPLTERASVPADSTPSRPRRPSGPRQRAPSGESIRHRPSPLDLSGISNYEGGRRDVAALNV